MTPLPAALGGSGLVAWRIERSKYVPEWHSAEGAFRYGGRWSSPGRRVLYTSLDPATTILELAIHAGFDVLDRVTHSLLELHIDPAQVRVVQPEDVPNPNWLHPGTVSANQQRFGDALLEDVPMVVIPSVVSRASWNLLIRVGRAEGAFRLAAEQRFALDPRLASAAVDPVQPALD